MVPLEVRVETQNLTRGIPRKPTPTLNVHPMWIQLLMFTIKGIALRLSEELEHFSPDSVWKTSIGNNATESVMLFFFSYLPHNNFRCKYCDLSRTKGLGRVVLRESFLTF